MKEASQTNQQIEKKISRNLYKRIYFCLMAEILDVLDKFLGI